MGKTASERGTEAANRLISEGIVPMRREDAIASATDLLARSEIAMVGSNGDGGYPNIKAMFKIRSEGLHHVWFSTNASSRRVAQFRADPKTCLYFFDPQLFCGLLLTGRMAIESDAEIRERLWREGWEAYYPQGAADPEYCVLQFTAGWGNFYHGLQNVSFSVKGGEFA